METTRHLDFKTPDITEAQEPSKGERLLIDLLSQSRSGQFLDIDLLHKNYSAAISEHNLGNYLEKYLRNDLEIRVGLLKQYGVDSVGHLDIQARTLSTLMRFSEIAVGVNPLKISDLKKMLAEGVTLKPDNIFVDVRLWPKQITEITSAIRAFEELGEQFSGRLSPTEA